MHEHTHTNGYADAQRFAEAMLARAKSMTWKGLYPVVKLSRKGYQKSIALGKKAMQAVERRLERHLELLKWDILIRPTSTAR